ASTDPDPLPWPETGAHPSAPLCRVGRDHRGIAVLVCAPNPGRRDDRLFLAPDTSLGARRRGNAGCCRAVADEHPASLGARTKLDWSRRNHPLGTYLLEPDRVSGPRDLVADSRYSAGGPDRDHRSRRRRRVRPQAWAAPVAGQAVIFALPLALAGARHRRRSG